MISQVNYGLMFFPPMCIGQQRVCSNGDCYCVPAPPRDLSSFDTLNKIGMALAQSQSFRQMMDVKPPSFEEHNKMYQASLNAKIWEYDFNKQYALRW
jgi:hypothetical protein